MSSKQFPRDEGWITLTLHLKPGAKVTKEEIINLAIGPEKIAEYEVGSFKALKTRATLIYRKKQLKTKV